MSDEQTPPGAIKTTFRRVGFALVLLALVWLFMGIVFPRILFTETPQVASVPESHDTNPSPDVAALTSRIDALEAKLSAPSSAETTSIDTSALEQKIVLLEEKLQAMQSSLATAGSNQEQVAQMAEKLQAIDHAMQERLAVTSAFSELKDAVRRGGRFREELNRLKELTASRKSLEPLITSLETFADQPAASERTLHDLFEATIPAALSATQEKHSLAANLQSLVRIRKVGEQQGTDDQSIIARAEGMLSRGDIAGVIASIDSLTPPARAAFGEWVKQATNITERRQLLDALGAALSKSDPEPATPVASTP